ncbi:hypothetical protein SARC_05104 [Sphaeroforma arctica JP610]|uniref:LTD domain-containing protein n=1 Tax=Sphaeroforma arctica JP610 TaxID=667725 RepID=A0A0L0G0I2_9EUKA|nr:hypothetical protein SARC_05104 [Sphaeroforma arctica JP610]KNC82607.1 hypothetical protein SARC_05104 [Sphaeroforma arctica JP610]|eukprot:XP_014156509.1 hypothetical protein SARC_05104 [Sphaeroforma arctica JP610]
MLSSQTLQCIAIWLSAMSSGLAQPVGTAMTTEASTSAPVNSTEGLNVTAYAEEPSLPIPTATLNTTVGSTLVSENSALAPTATSNSVPVSSTTTVLSPELSEINSGAMDWVELYNPQENSIDLSGFALVSDDEMYYFTGDCGTIDAKHYLLLVDEDAENPEYQNGNCKLPYGIKTSGHLELVDPNGDIVDVADWNNVAYVAGHSYAKTESGDWAATSTQTPFSKNVFTDEITMPTVVDFSSGLYDRDIAYVQNPPFGSITNVHLRVYSSSSECECWQFQEAHNDEKCDCTWDDVNEDETSRDLTKATMPCSVSIDVDDEPEFWYDNVNAANSSDRQPRTDVNCDVAVRGGFSRESSIKSYNIKIGKTIVPRTWRGLKRLNMVKMPWELTGGAITTALYEQFAQMKHWNGMRTTVANLTVTVVDPDSEEIIEVLNMGRYNLFENIDEDALDRHGQAARTLGGDRLESHVYKLNEFDFNWKDQYDNMPAVIDETDEQAMFEFEYRLEAKDSLSTLKLQEVMKNLNDRGNMSFVDAVHKHFDMDNLATFVAVNVLCGDIDHSAKNSYIYSTTGTDKWYMTPWDYDASWQPIMDMGPQASSPQRYQDHYLFRGILFHDELRDEFYPLYKEKVRELQEGYFARDTIEGLITKHANVLEPFFQSGKVDRDVLGIRAWDSVESTTAEFDPVKMNYNLSPHTNVMGQFDFITGAVQEFTYDDPPPIMFDPIFVEEVNDDDTKFKLYVNPVFSPVDNHLETVINIYKNRPFDEFVDPDDSDSIYEDRFYEPEWEDVVLATTVDPSVVADVEWDNRFVVELDCEDVEECADTDCWVTSYTKDVVTGERSAGGSVEKQARFEGSGCSF